MKYKYQCNNCIRKIEADNFMDGWCCPYCKVGVLIGLSSDDLVTGTPVIKEKKPFNYSLFFEWVKLVQRVIMVVLTVILVMALNRSAIEIGALKVETRRIASIAERGCVIAEETRIEIYKKIEEIQKNGIKFKIRLW